MVVNVSLFSIEGVGLTIAAYVGGLGLVWNFPTVRPEPQLIILFS